MKQLPQQLLQLLLLFIILEQSKHSSNHVLSEVSPTLELVCYFQKCFLTFEQLPQQLLQLLLMFIMLKQPQHGSNHVLSEF